MKLTILGRYAPWNPPGGACSGYLVTQGATHLLIDGGNGVLARLQSAVTAEDLTAAVLTHFHPDHFADLHSLRYWIQAAQREGRRTGPLPLYGPPKPRMRGTNSAQELTDWTAGRVWTHAERLVEFRSYRPGQVLRVGDLEVRFTRTVHSAPCYALRVSGGGASLFFSADSSRSGRLVALARGVDLALVEASLLDRDSALRRLGHMTAADAAELATKAGAGRLLLTHLYPSYDHDLLLREARAVFPGAELAEEGRTYLIEATEERPPAY